MNKPLVNQKKENLLYSKVAEIIELSRKRTIATVNLTMVHAYFEVGRAIVEDEQQGKHRAEYGKHLLTELSARLTRQFRKGFSVDNLERMKYFYTIYSEKISATPLRKLQNTDNLRSISRKASPKSEHYPFNLSWSHYLKLMRIDNPGERSFYEIECAANNWSLKELQRQFDSGLYERLALSRDKAQVKQLSQKGQLIEQPKDIIKDPYILEFLGLPEQAVYSETQLETKIIE